MTNLDCATDEDLRRFADRLLRCPRFSRCDSHGVMLGNLHSYALGVIDSRDARIAVDVQQALRIEAVMDEIYDSLPEKYRW